MLQYNFWWQPWVFVFFAFCLLQCKSRPHTNTQIQQPPTQETRPQWVQQRPISSLDYIGIGVARKASGSTDHLEIAKRNALQDMISQISVQVSANSMLYQVEGNRAFSEQYANMVRLQSNVKIEDYEIVGTWENKDEYWVYYRLSRAAYQQWRETQIKQAIDEGADLWLKGITAEQEGQVGAALRFYFTAFEALREYLAEPLHYNHQGNRVLLGNELLAAVSALVRNTSIKVDATANRTRAGTMLPGVVLVTTINKQTGRFLQQVPIRVRYQVGNGRIEGPRTTNNMGQAAFRVTAGPANQTVHQISFQPSFEELIDDRRRFALWMNLIDLRNVEETRWQFQVSRPVVAIEAEELIFGKDFDNQPLTNKIKQMLGNSGFVFGNSNNADFIIRLKADTQEGAVNHGMFTALLNASLQVTETQAGKTLYARTLNNIRGIQLNYREAAVDAYKRTEQQFEQTVISEISEQLLKP